MSAKRINGKVISTKMQKTIVVSVDTLKRHPVYDKVIKRTKNYKARCDMEVKEGNVVVIEECRPFSKEVTWKVVEVISKDGDK